MQIKNVTFIGLGVMGYNMAGHLKKNNFNTTVYNRTSSVADKWVNEFSGTSAPTPGIAVSNADIVFICVGRDEDLISVMEGDDGIIKNLKDNTIVVDHTTASADIARKYFQKAKEIKKPATNKMPVNLLNVRVDDIKGTKSSTES